MKATKDNTGGYLQLDIKALDGPAAGNSNVIRLNIFNASQQAKDIAHRQLSAICHVISVFDVQEMPQPDNATPMLHGRPFRAYSVVQKNPETGQTGNNFTRYADVNGVEPGKGMAQQPQQQPQYAPQPQPQINTQPGVGQQWVAPPPQPPVNPAPQWTQPPAPQPGGYVPPPPQQPTYQPPAPQPPQQPVQPPAQQWTQAAPQPQPGQPGGPTGAAPWR